MDPNGTGHARPILASDREDNRVTPRMILNPGSVGQPRDRDSRASYAIFDMDEDRWEHYRVEYNVAEVQQRIIALGLPIRHAIRLSEGW
jgi:diadenosine tetraphosphatase ApaH/serine/threonine PP2A family protein phosphatase